MGDDSSNWVLDTPMQEQSCIPVAGTHCRGHSQRELVNWSSPSLSLALFLSLSKIPEAEWVTPSLHCLLPTTLCAEPPLKGNFPRLGKGKIRAGVWAWAGPSCTTYFLAQSWVPSHQLSRLCLPQSHGPHTESQGHDSTQLQVLRLNRAHAGSPVSRGGLSLEKRWGK